jgi:cystathionine beta-lyase
MEKQQSNAIIVSQYLESLGLKVRYPGLKSHPQYELHRQQATGPGAVLSFETGDVTKSEKVVEATRLWAISVSFGCVNSLIRFVALEACAWVDSDSDGYPPLVCPVVCRMLPYRLKSVVSGRCPRI